MTISKLFSSAGSSFLVLIVSSGCSEHYYTAKTVTPVSKYPAVIEKAQKKQSYMLMQSGINLYTVKSIEMHKTKQEMTVTLDKVDSARTQFLSNLIGKATGPKKREPAIQSQVRLYLVDSASYTYDEPHTIPMSKLSRVEVVD